ncbi:MAG: SulP family inorganic anion transporter, partial [Verrucomicrobiales bacterium]
MFDIFTKKRGNLKDDVLSGLTVALALVPEAIAFSFVAGVPPLSGLYAAFFMGTIIDFKDGRVCDYSSIEAINALAERYKKAGLSLHLRHLSPECRKMIHDAGELVEVDIIEDPRYTIARF